MRLLQQQTLRNSNATLRHGKRDTNSCGDFEDGAPDSLANERTSEDARTAYVANSSETS